MGVQENGRRSLEGRRHADDGVAAVGCRVRGDIFEAQLLELADSQFTALWYRRAETAAGSATDLNDTLCESCLACDPAAPP